MKKAILPLILTITIIFFYADEKNYLNLIFNNNISIKTDSNINKEDIEIKSIPTNNEDEIHFLVTYKDVVKHTFKHKKSKNNQDYFYTFKMYQKNNNTLLDVTVKNTYKEHYTSLINTSFMSNEKHNLATTDTH